MNYVSKPWGWELWITNNDKYCGKLLFIKQGHRCSYHFHKVKDEVLYIQEGECEFSWADPEGEPVTEVLPPGHAFHVTVEGPHQMEAIQDTLIIEFSTQHFDEDSYRITRDKVVGRRLDS